MNLEVIDLSKVKPSLDIGDTIIAAGITWRKFSDDGNSSYMISDRSITECPFGDSNDWASSPIRRILSVIAERLKKELGGRMLPIAGSDEEYVSILPAEIYHNCKKNIKPIDQWWWLCTSPLTLSGRTHSFYVDCVAYDIVYAANHDKYGAVRPYFIIKGK